MTSHPKDLSDELIETIAENDKICRHLHLPLQSGSNSVLKRMNRKYTKESYLELINKIRNKIPDISITTDIIVGFPGETEEDFKDTLDVVKESRFDSAFTFIYSKRTGTPAAEMSNQVDSATIKNRFDVLLKLVQNISAEQIKIGLGSVQKVLVEEVNTHMDGYLTGKLSNNNVVHFMGNPSLVGSIVNVKLSEAKGFYYLGTKVE